MSLYYEAHVTIEPVFDERLELFIELCNKQKFRVAKLLLQKRKNDTPERSKNDSFCTGIDSDLESLRKRMVSLLDSLRQHRFTVWRYKIEDAIIDSRIDASLWDLSSPT